MSCSAPLLLVDHKVSRRMHANVIENAQSCGYGRFGSLLLNTERGNDELGGLPVEYGEVDGKSLARCVPLARAGRKRIRGIKRWSLCNVLCAVCVCQESARLPLLKDTGG